MRADDESGPSAAKPGKANLADPRYAALFVIAGLALVLLVLFRGSTLPLAQTLTVAATLTLFVTPGMIPALTLPGRVFSGMARLPVAFVFSTGMFGFLALPMLVLHQSLALYVWLCSGVVAVAVLIAAIAAVRGSGRGLETGPQVGLPGKLLWAVFGSLGVLLAFVSRNTVVGPNEDRWYYLAHVQEFLRVERLATSDPFYGATELGLRLRINGWLLEQTAFSQVSGLDAVALTTDYLTPVFLIIALLALYTLARVLFESIKAALVASILGAIFLLADLNLVLESVSTYLVARPTEDKSVAWLVFLPVALAFAVLFVRERKPWYLVLFAFVCWSVVTVHPLGLVFIGIPLAGFGLIHLALGWRLRRTWVSLAGLATAVLSIGLPPTIYLLATGNPLLSRLESQDESRSVALLETLEKARQLFALENGTYIVHPSSLLEPALLVAYVLGTPFLLWRLRRDPAEQLLLGTLLLVPLLVFFPPVTSVLGPIVGPWTLPRLAWPLLFPIAPLVAGWLASTAIDYAASYLGNFSRVEGLRPFVPLLLLGVALVAVTPLVLGNVRSANASGEVPQDMPSCTDPAFRHMQDVITPQSLILAPRYENSCLTAHVAEANVMQIRPLNLLEDVPPTQLDSVEGENLPPSILAAQKFMASIAVDTDMTRTLREYRVNYVLLSSSSTLNEQLLHLPGFEELDLPGQRYRLYRVSKEQLQTTPVVEANGFLNDGEWERAAEAYGAAPVENANDQYLVYLGLGQAYAELGRYEEAIDEFEAATRLFPKEPEPYVRLAGAQEAAGDMPAARASQKKAVARAPLNVKIRLEFVRLLQIMGKERKLVEQHREIVEAFPKVPEYRVRLGGALVLTKDYEAADEEFRKAERLNPRSPTLFALMGNANKASGRLEEALSFYERALELDPGNPEYALQVGLMHARIAIRNDDDGHAEQAERELEEATRAPLSQEKKATAWFALGQLYELRGRPDEAERAFEESLRANPDSEPARTALEELDQ